MAKDTLYLTFDPVYRHLLKLKDQAEKENASADIKSEISKVIDLFQARERFCEQQTTALSSGVQKIIDETRSHPWQKAYQEGKISYKVSPEMLSGKLEAQFLKSLAGVGKVKTVLELGLLTGCSALSIAEALPEDGKIYSCEIDPYTADIAKSFFEQSPAGKKVQIMIGPAKESMWKLAERKMQFDIIFIDADKPSYCDYYKLVFEYGLLAVSGTIVVDNALYRGYPYCHQQCSKNDNGPAIERFNEMVIQDDSVHRPRSHKTDKSVDVDDLDYSHVTARNNNQKQSDRNLPHEMAKDSLYLILDPAYRHLLKLKDQAEKENASADIKSEISKIIDLFQARERFCEQQTTALSSGVQKIIDETRSHPWQKAYEEGKASYKASPEMLSGKLEDQFLKSLVSMGKVKTVLELGLFTGGSALSIAEALPEDGKIYSCEIDPYIADVAKSFFDQSPVGKKVQIMLGPAKESMSKLAERKMQFDMIFIDADKPGYCEYYKLVFEYGLLATRGTIVVDNALYQGYPYCHEQRSNNDNGPSIERFNELVIQDDSVHRVLLPVRDGVMIIRRKTDV